jgi:hypothetical protein
LKLHRTKFDLCSPSLVFGVARFSLPNSDTDGGRIAVTMFGRSGALLVKTFTTIALCVAGLVGFDDAGVLLNYVLLVVLWQSELEAPARNEVEELDVVRGCTAIVAAVLVVLILWPVH